MMANYRKKFNIPIGLQSLRSGWRAEKSQERDYSRLITVWLNPI